MKILLGKSETSEAVSLSESTILRMVRSGEFPKPVNIGSRVLWRATDLQEWSDKLQQHNPIKKETRGRKRLAV